MVKPQVSWRAVLALPFLVVGAVLILLSVWIRGEDPC